MSSTPTRPGYHDEVAYARFTLPYTGIRDVTVKGCQLQMHTAGTPRRIALSVASVDGERLYRELHMRYPLATDRWQ